MSDRPRLFYVPIAAAFEAERVAELAPWAVVESADSPGAGAARAADPAGIDGVVRSALARLDELGWERCTLVCDSHGQAAGIELALRTPERFDAICISHAAARYELDGDRPAMVPAVHQAAEQLLMTDYRSFARAITQLTLGLADDAWMDRWIESVPQPVARSILHDLSTRRPELAAALAATSLRVVLGRHRGCLMWTKEAFEDAAAALPEATTVVSDGIPLQDPAFIAAVRAAATP